MDFSVSKEMSITVDIYNSRCSTEPQRCSGYQIIIMVNEYGCSLRNKSNNITFKQSLHKHGKQSKLNEHFSLGFIWTS